MLDCIYCSGAQVKEPAEDLSNLLKVLNEQMDVWIEEHCAIETSFMRKQHLWFVHILPAEKQRFQIKKMLANEKKQCTTNTC